MIGDRSAVRTGLAPDLRWRGWGLVREDESALAGALFLSRATIFLPVTGVPERAAEYVPVDGNGVP